MKPFKIFLRKCVCVLISHRPLKIINEFYRAYKRAKRGFKCVFYVMEWNIFAYHFLIAHITCKFCAADNVSNTFVDYIFKRYKIYMGNGNIIPLFWSSFQSLYLTISTNRNLSQ